MKESLRAFQIFQDRLNHRALFVSQGPRITWIIAEFRPTYVNLKISIEDDYIFDGALLIEKTVKQILEGMVGDVEIYDYSTSWSDPHHMNIVLDLLEVKS